MDPDNISVSDWCDVAWAYIMDTSSAMMNPFEFRETMWAVLHEGDEPPKRDKPKEVGPAKPVRAATKSTARDARALDEFNAQILALQERRSAEPAQPEK